MLLQPRRYTYKTRHKKRSQKTFKGQTLHYGTTGIRTLQPFRFTGKQIFRFFIFLKKSSRKSDRTKRLFWLNAFPHLPLTRKAKGVRMGKGTGKLHSWFTTVRAGTVLVEFANLRSGRAKHFMNQIRFKLAIPTTVVTTQTKNIKVAGGNATNTSTQPFYLT